MRHRESNRGSAKTLDRPYLRNDTTTVDMRKLKTDQQDSIEKGDEWTSTIMVNNVYSVIWGRVCDRGERQSTKGQDGGSIRLDSSSTIGNDLGR